MKLEVLCPCRKNWKFWNACTTIIYEFIALGLQALEQSQHTINNTVVYEQKRLGITTYKYMHFVHSKLCTKSIYDMDT